MEFMHRLCLGVVLLIWLTPFVGTRRIVLPLLQQLPTPKTDCEGAVQIQSAAALAGERFLALVVQLGDHRLRATRLRLRLQTDEGFSHSEIIECAQICFKVMTPPDPPRRGHCLKVWVEDISGIFPWYTACTWEPYSVEVEGLSLETLDMTLNQTLTVLRSITDSYRIRPISIILYSIWLVFLLLISVKPVVKCCKWIKSRANGTAGNNHSNGSIEGSSAPKQCRVQVVAPLPDPNPTAPPATPTADRWHSLASILLPAAAPPSSA